MEREREHLGNHVIFIGYHIFEKFVHKVKKVIVKLWVQFFWKLCSLEHFLFKLLLLVPIHVPQAMLLWNVSSKFLGTSSWNIISWGTLPRSHANPTSPCLVRALRRRVAGCRGRLRQRPSLRLCCGSSLSRSPRLRFFFPVIFKKKLVCCNEFFFSCCAAYCCDFNFFLILGGGGGG